MFAIIKKELKQYFYSMVGFVFLAFFLAIVGLYTWAGNLSQGISAMLLPYLSICG